jgi:cytochrome P450 family 12
LDKDSETEKLIDCALQLFQLIYKIDILPSMSKFMSTPNWKKLIQVLDFMLQWVRSNETSELTNLIYSRTNLKYINQTLDKLETKKLDEDEKSSVLQKLLKLDRNIAVGMSLDMMIAGIDTVRPQQSILSTFICTFFTDR